MAIEFVSKAKLPTQFGDFIVHAFRDSGGHEHLALVRGSLAAPTHVRLHSKCLTGDTLASLRCDCRAQLESALTYLSKRGGILLYMDQEGRGIGLANKIKAYALQDEGKDTVEANRILGFPDDLRDYSAAAAMLYHLGVRQINLLTNNPSKLADLSRHGIEIAKRIPLQIRPTPHNKKYIEAKKNKLNHLL